MTAATDIQLHPDGTVSLPNQLELGDSIYGSFKKGLPTGIIALASTNTGSAIPPFLGFWRNFGRDYLTELCHRGSGDPEMWEPVPLPTKGELAKWVEMVPPAPGGEYVSAEFLSNLWTFLNHLVAGETKQGKTLSRWLEERNPLWKQIGRVTFHLAENPRDEEKPFTFLATYTHRLSSQSKLQYLPLGNAIKRFGEKKDQKLLKSILAPLREAAQLSPFVRGLVESKEVFQALAWSPDQAFQFLECIPTVEECGITAKVPDWWKAGRPSRPKVSVQLDAKSLSLGGIQSLLSFRIDKTLDGEKLTDKEWEKLVNASSGLVSIKGQWVEVDAAKLEQALEHWKKVEQARAVAGISFAQGMRMLAGFRQSDFAKPDPSSVKNLGEWTDVVPQKGLKELLTQIRDPKNRPKVPPNEDLQATLRPYQETGVDWLCLMRKLGLGACLADDMGLGKTIQVIAAFLHEKRTQQKPNLLIVPASLLGNWRNEIRQFAPSLRVFYAHPSMSSKEELQSPRFGNIDLVISTFSMMTRLPSIVEGHWNILAIDEAQALKNPASTQTQAAKALNSQHRIALTGTPIENSITDLWSLFDFLNPGLLGTAAEFKTSIKNLSLKAEGYSPIRRLIAPFILRRLKTDRTIIADLPDKLEVNALCPLSKGQTAIYQQNVRQLAKDLSAPESSGIQRKGLVLSYLMKFKQICDHPGLLTGSGNFEEKHSGKFQRLRVIAEELFSRGEKVLIFTQFREMADPLTEFLDSIAPGPGLTLHGGTTVKKRQELVRKFQEPDGPPFFVISLKAGGTGLNLTAASHVIHFDRWWNPSVENQATDRAFRIGQKRNVFVHKFVCPGTIEEKIDRLIAAKTEIAEELVGQPSAQANLMEMSDAELLDFVALDLRSVFS